MKKVTAFTLAEVLVTLAILGVVAAITIPSTVRRQQERANKTRLLKAMAAWENFVPIFLSENGLNNEVDAGELFNNSPDCTVVTKYFKTNNVKDTRGKCIFETADGVTWTFETTMFDDKVYKSGLSARVQLPGMDKIMIDGHAVVLPDGDNATYFRFYFTRDAETGALYINDSEHTPWYHWQGSNWCGQHPFGHGCWSGMLEYDSMALLPWQYLKMIEYHKYNWKF